VGAANAWTGALGGVANAAGQVGNYYQGQQTLKQLMANPASVQALANLPQRRNPYLTNPALAGTDYYGFQH
jgi:hypothetical protein